MTKKEMPIIAKVHYVEFTLPDRYGSGRKKRIEIYSRTEGWTNKIEGFEMQTTSYGSLSLRDSRIFVSAMEKAVRRMAELTKLYKGKEVIFERNLY